MISVLMFAWKKYGVNIPIVAKEGGGVKGAYVGGFGEKYEAWLGRGDTV